MVDSIDYTYSFMSRKGQGHEMTMNQSHQTWYGTSSETHDHKLFCCQWKVTLIFKLKSDFDQILSNDWTLLKITSHHQ